MPTDQFIKIKQQQVTTEDERPIVLPLNTVAQRPYYSSKFNIDVAKTVKHQLLYNKLELSYKKNGGEKNLLLIFLVDSSGSMLTQIPHLKGIISKTINKYQQRAVYFSLVALTNGDATLLTMPTSNCTILLNQMHQLKTGGKTNMAKGFYIVSELIAQQKNRNSYRLYIFTDGKVNSGETSDPFQEAVTLYQQRLKNVSTTLINTETGFIRLNKAKELALALKAKYIEFITQNV